MNKKLPPTDFCMMYAMFAGYKIAFNDSWKRRVKDLYKDLSNGVKYNPYIKQSITYILVEKYLQYENYLTTL